MGYFCSFEYLFIAENNTRIGMLCQQYRTTIELGCGYAQKTREIAMSGENRRITVHSSAKPSKCSMLVNKLNIETNRVTVAIM